jgi:peptidoglycan/xylan/chitin deacetylase (PgdA/CDA1 family)
MKVSNVLAVLATASVVSAAAPTTCKTTGQIAITFDGGPSPGSTAYILDTLRTKNVKATFHVITTYIDNLNAVPAALNKMVEDGHEIGIRIPKNENDVSKMSPEQVVKAVQGYAQKITDTCGFKPTFVRAESGAFTDDQLKALNAAGFYSSGVSLDSMDYKGDPAVLPAYQNAFGQMGSMKGSFIALHLDIPNTTTPGTLSKVIDLINEKGYAPVKMGECLITPLRSSNAGSSAATWTGLALIGSTALAVFLQMF